ncbi:hypothetical protein OEZ85_007415 [Tetradesmus obliquus]|uniref:Carboxypeptidase n=1 Tax=Tetradesmus obliquus TaxID=3088 RepID=A0ABY8TKA0_TETOB|nr:hypothetical protein OEZ85_007415 [Tetradesmus obliquus]
MADSNTEGESCWVCLSGLEDAPEKQLELACRCPRPVHRECLARWQLQQAGRREEHYCRFCEKAYPDWKDSLTPKELKPSTPIMAVSVRGRVHKLRVRPGPDGKEDFKRQVRALLGYDDSMEFDVIFECKTPHSGEKWLAHGQQQTTLWHTTASYAITDATFVLGSLLFLYVAIKYGDTRKERPAPYPGAWVEADGRQHAPRGFAPGYLGFALVWSLIIPAAVLLLSSGQACQPLAAATLGPYLLVFVPQIALETKYLNRSFMTPVLPLLFMYYRLWQFVRSLALVAAHTAAAASSQQQQHWLTRAQIQKPLHAGYIPISRTDSSNPSSLYYAYWEAAEPAGGAVDDQTPIILWLQGGPGCASSFGALYELGPTVVDSSGVPTPNPYSFNQAAGLLVIDQPIGTGYSIAGSTDDIPTDMQGMAADLYEGLWSFFDSHPQLQPRPFFITGESYAGKYIPSLTHYILRAAASRPWHQQQQQQEQQQQEEQQEDQLRSQPQQQQQDEAYCSGLEQLQRQLRSSKQQPVLLLPLLRRRALQRCPGLLRHAQQQPQQQQGVKFQDGVPDPNFQLAGIAIGNGLTDPIAQTRALGSVTFNFGLISEATRTQLQQQAEVVITLVQAQQWAEAAQMRSRLLQFIEQASGVATLLDIRRTAVYDSAEAVQSLLNSTEVKALMSADASVDYASCSDAVDAVLKADTMKSASALVEDILDVLPVLLYQGQFDAQDGVASTNAWLAGLSWEYARDFAREPGQVWQVDGLPAGWQRGASTLTQVVVRNAGHMVPRDQPKAALQLLQGWMQGQLVNNAAAEAAAAELQQQLDSGSSSSSMGGVSTSYKPPFPAHPFDTRRSKPYDQRLSGAAHRLLDDQRNQGGDDNQGDQDNGDDQGRRCRRIRRRYTIKENDSIEEIARSVYADFQGPLEKKINLIKYCNRELLFIKGGGAQVATVAPAQFGFTIIIPQIPAEWEEQARNALDQLCAGEVYQLTERMTMTRVALRLYPDWWAIVSFIVNYLNLCNQNVVYYDPIKKILAAPQELRTLKK